MENQRPRWARVRLLSSVWCVWLHKLLLTISLIMLIYIQCIFSIFSYTIHSPSSHILFITVYTISNTVLSILGRSLTAITYSMASLRYVVKVACYSNTALAFISISNYFCCYVVMYDFLHTGEKPYAISNEASPRYGKNFGLVFCFTHVHICQI